MRSEDLRRALAETGRVLAMIGLAALVVAAADGIVILVVGLLH